MSYPFRCSFKASHEIRERTLGHLDSTRDVPSLDIVVKSVCQVGKDVVNLMSLGGGSQRAAQTE